MTNLITELLNSQMLSEFWNVDPKDVRERGRLVQRVAQKLRFGESDICDALAKMYRDSYLGAIYSNSMEVVCILTNGRIPPGEAAALINKLARQVLALAEFEAEQS